MTFEEQYATLLDRLPPAERRAVVRSATSAILEGWAPTHAQVELQVQRAAGELTGDQYRARVIANARRNRLAHSAH